ncbi:MAG: hypothetical protein C5B49_12135 [Bdellovibrio sp.]|nr:MAG: hypothetical protein C5B49_12135 [Bdellovibrio sp.]
MRKFLNTRGGSAAHALSVLVLAFVLDSSMARAWESRGHHVICESAVFLVENQELQKFLRERIQTMVHLCNIPDSYWRSLGSEVSQIGSPTHYIYPEVIGTPIRDFPLDFAKLREQYEGAPDPSRPGPRFASLAKELGTLWWRADQFVRRATESARTAAAAKAPSRKEEEQQAELPFNQAVYEMTVNMGLLGHFVGDGSMPFHSTADLDGYAQNHGGIHKFYETTVVNAEDEKLTADVVARARQLMAEIDHPAKKPKKKTQRNAKAEKYAAKMPEVQFLRLPTPLEKMRALSAISADDIATVLQNDPTTGKSSVKLENGKDTEYPAPRTLSPKAVANYRPIIVEHLARSAALLAQFWDLVFTQGGNPKLSEYKYWQFPFKPEFVPPDYIPGESVAGEQRAGEQKNPTH